MSSAISAADIAVAAGSELNKFACSIVSDTFGIPFEEIILITQKSYTEMYNSDIAEVMSERYGIDIAAIMELVQMVMEIVMQFIDGCESKSLMTRIIKNQRPISRAWFKVNYFNDCVPQLREQVGLTSKQETELFGCICVKAADLSEAEINAINEEVEIPDFNIF